MKIELLIAAARAGVVVLLLQGFTAGAAEIKVLSTGAIRHGLHENFSNFERATGHKVATQYEGTMDSQRRIEAGEPFDVAILSFDVDKLIKRGKIVPGTRVVLGHTGVGVGVRKGAMQPDITSPEAFKHTMLNAKSVAYSRGTSGVYFLSLLDRLGIAKEMKSKLRPQLGGDTAKAVLTGDAEIVVGGAVLILTTEGAELVGWLPAELQTYVLFTGGIGTAAKEAEPGRALLSFLTTPAAVAVFKAKGLEPGAPR
jgi:molybdate transport system substrate-binding protein